MHSPLHRIPDTRNALFIENDEYGEILGNKNAFLHVMMNENQSRLGYNKHMLKTAEVNFRKVPLRWMRLNAMVAFDLFIQPQNDRSLVFYRDKNLPFAELERDRLLENGVDEVYVPKDQEKAYLRYIEDHLSSILNDPSVPPEEKAELLYGALVNNVQDIMHDPRAGDAVPRSRAIVENTCTFLYEQRGSLEYMMRVCAFDYYTFTHSVNVFVFAMALAQRVFAPLYVRGDFGLGALLHDVGKCRIPNNILNHRGKLTKEQFEIMKKHTTYGYEILAEKGQVSDLVLDMCRHHHEKLDGTGYPDGLSREQICREVRILTIADIFDALTTRRSYKSSMDSFPALKMMREEMSHHLDLDLFKIFVRMMGNPGGAFQIPA